jgi:hypothetical protein
VHKSFRDAPIDDHNLCVAGERSKIASPSTGRVDLFEPLSHQAGSSARRVRPMTGRRLRLACRDRSGSGSFCEDSAIGLSSIGLLQGSGATRTSLRINFWATIAIQVPVAFALAFGLGLYEAGVWWSFRSGLPRRR